MNKDNLMEQSNEIQRGIVNDEFVLYYQPQFNLKAKKITGLEVLLRWNHKDKGVLSPKSFLPAAKLTNNIYLLDKWVLNKTLHQMSIWEKKGFPCEFSINLSAKTLESEQYFSEIDELIHFYNIDYSNLIVEVTESVFFNNLSMVSKRLNHLRSHNIKIALEDFCTSYTLIKHIHELPVDIIKIDKSFIQSLEISKNSDIVKNIISMENDLNCRVILEGIEKRSQLNYLMKLSCNIGQVYFSCIPLPIEKVKRLIQ